MTEFVREDWTKFRSLGELPRAAGVKPERLKKLVAKELADNALDAAGSCRIEANDGVLWVEDDGNGIPGTADEIAALFSIARPQTSSKQLRLPTRGALGNGLRVVAGYVLATRAKLRVFTLGQAYDLAPQDDGRTFIEAREPWPGSGTRVEIHPGPGDHFYAKDLAWAFRAIDLSGTPTYTGCSSPYWFDEDAFWELCQAFSGTARDLVAKLDGCANPKAGAIAAPWKSRAAASLSRTEAGELLAAARDAAKPRRPESLGFIGPAANWGYAKETGEFSPPSAGGTLRAALPFVVEVRARIVEVGREDRVQINVNRTPVTTEVESWRQKERTELAIGGCGLGNLFTVGVKPVRLEVNVQTPYMPITSDGKAPDLRPMLNALQSAIKKATNSAKRHHLQASPAARRRPETAIVRAVLNEAIRKASGDGANRYSLRQLYYQVRPFIITELGKEPTYENFAKIITEIESDNGEDLAGIYRDTRGVLYHPHTGEEFALGTLSVEGYKRPDWTFNKILYCEKEGFFQLLKDTKWPERHDCALLTSKGQPTRAARDIIDLMGDGAEDLTFFCVHDADAAGTIIYQSLQGATKARGARRVSIINLGLEPKEALAMGLDPERIEAPKKGERPVADYVAPEWREWLQTQRVELNAMTSPQFIEWLDRKMQEHDGSKLVPPQGVMEAKLAAATLQKVQSRITAQVLAAADIEGRAEQAMRSLNGHLTEAASSLNLNTRTALEANPALWWVTPVDAAADALASKAKER